MESSDEPVVEQEGIEATRNDPETQVWPPQTEPRLDEPETSSPLLEPDPNMPTRREDTRSYLLNEGTLRSSNVFDRKTSNQKFGKDSDLLQEAKYSVNKGILTVWIIFKSSQIDWSQSV